MCPHPIHAFNFIKITLITCFSPPLMAKASLLLSNIALSTQPRLWSETRWKQSGFSIYGAAVAVLSFSFEFPAAESAANRGTWVRYYPLAVAELLFEPTSWERHGEEHYLPFAHRKGGYLLLVYAFPSLGGVIVPCESQLNFDSPELEARWWRKMAAWAEIMAIWMVIKTTLLSLCASGPLGRSINFAECLDSFTQFLVAPLLCISSSCPYNCLFIGFFNWFIPRILLFIPPELSAFWLQWQGEGAWRQGSMELLRQLRGYSKGRSSWDGCEVCIRSCIPCWF